MSFARAGCLIGIGLSVSLASGCSPKAPPREPALTQAIQELCATEYKLTVSAKLLGTTLGVQVHQPGIFTRTAEQVSLSPNAFKILDDLVEAVHRVILNAKADLRFYVLVLSDPEVPSLYLTLVRYMDDVRRAHAMMFGPTEFLSRTIIELKLAPPDAVNLEGLLNREIHLEEFLSWQLTRRIQQNLTEQFQLLGIADVGQCRGEFREGAFTFVLELTPKPGRTLDDATVQDLFHRVTTLIAKVLSSYQFDAFEAVHLTLPTHGRSVSMPKTQLWVFK